MLQCCCTRSLAAETACCGNAHNPPPAKQPQHTQHAHLVQVQRGIHKRHQTVKRIDKRRRVLFGCIEQQQVLQAVVSVQAVAERASVCAVGAVKTRLGSKHRLGMLQAVVVVVLV